MVTPETSVGLRPVHFRDLGMLEYQAAWDYQEELFRNTVDLKLSNRNKSPEEQEETEDYLLFVEHPPVFTLGKSGNSEHLLLSEKELRERHIGYFPINRGGDITYHGPGQLVGYPILDLDHFFTDIHRYLRSLEEAIIRTCAEYGVECGRIEGLTGVWMDAADPFRARKIAALGVKCSRWVTMHGFAFNVNTDLTNFRHIIPCGITDKAVTSLHLEAGHSIDMASCKDRMLKHLSEIFGIRWIRES